MERTGRTWAWGLFLILVAGGVAWWAAGSPLPAALGRRLGSARPPLPGASHDSQALGRVAALGRIEPRRGVIRVAGPPRPAVVIEQLLVEEGDRVKKGQVIAMLAGIGVQRAEVAQLRAELANAERELERNRKLRSGRVLSDSEWQALELSRAVARAGLDRAEAELEMSQVRSPIDGQILEIHALEGERVGPAGVVELGQTSAMYVVAEIYETDIGRVHVGQSAIARSPALLEPLEGEIERIGLKVGKKDVLSTDPVADADARVVEVKIRLEEPALAAALTNLRVDVIIEPSARR